MSSEDDAKAQAYDLMHLPTLDSPFAHTRSRRSIQLRALPSRAVTPCPKPPAGACVVAIPPDGAPPKPPDLSARTQYILDRMQRWLCIDPSYVTSRHPSAALVLTAVFIPTWLTAPLLTVVWGYFGHWDPVFWGPSLLYVARSQALAFCSLYSPAAEYIHSGTGRYLTVASVLAYSVVVGAPLWIHPFCRSCIPFQDLLYTSLASAALSWFQVRAPLPSNK